MLHVLKTENYRRCLRVCKKINDRALLVRPFITWLSVNMVKFFDKSAVTLIYLFITENIDLFEIFVNGEIAAQQRVYFLIFRFGNTPCVYKTRIFIFLAR